MAQETVYNPPGFLYNTTRLRFGKVVHSTMLQFEELKRQLEEQEKALASLGDSLGLEKLREEVDMLEHKSAEPGFWDNMEQAQKITQRMAAL